MAQQAYDGPLEQVGPCRWRIPRTYKPGMRVDGVIYADERLIGQIRRDQAPEQVANVATLPGIQMHSLAMPDIHWGYGFAIGGVAATDPREDGVISPGGVGYDINCGVRLIRSNLVHADVRDHVRRLRRVSEDQAPRGRAPLGTTLGQRDGMPQRPSVAGILRHRHPQGRSASLS